MTVKLRQLTSITGLCWWTLIYAFLKAIERVEKNLRSLRSIMDRLNFMLFYYAFYAVVAQIGEHFFAAKVFLSILRQSSTFHFVASVLQTCRCLNGAKGERLILSEHEMLVERPHHSAVFAQALCHIFITFRFAFRKPFEWSRYFWHYSTLFSNRQVYCSLKSQFITAQLLNIPWWLPIARCLETSVENQF